MHRSEWVDDESCPASLSSPVLVVSTHFSPADVQTDPKKLSAWRLACAKAGTSADHITASVVSQTQIEEDLLFLSMGRILAFDLTKIYLLLPS